MSDASQITVSFEWAKKLKEAGWPQYESVFVWEADGNNGKLILASGGALRATSPFTYFAAPAAEEILRRLPDCEMGHDHHSGWWVGVDIEIEMKDEHGETYDAHVGRIFDSSLANAAAALACYLVEQGLLSFKND